MSNRLPDILSRWIYNGTFTADELADAAECSTATIYKYAEGDRNIPFARVRRIHKKLAGPRGHNEIPDSLLTADWEICPRGEAAANGKIEDELRGMVETLSDISNDHRDGDRDGLSEAIGKAEVLLARVKAERDRL